jgi:homoserine kinase
VEQRRVRVQCPATSANLGPGFDALGLALSLHNDVVAQEVGAGVQVTVDGEGHGTLPTDRDNLVARSAALAFGRLGRTSPGLHLSCTNGIPPARGLGSSAAAIVAGVSVAYALANPGTELDRTWVLDLAGAIEGHPDNVAACVLGGATVGWRDAAGATNAVRVDPHPDVTATLLVPDVGSSTTVARAMLPEVVPHADAAHAAGRAALFVAAITARPDLLLAATEDRLHQPYRASAMTATYALVERLRGLGLAAVVSGAGPAVLMLHATGSADLEAAVGDLPTGWRSMRLEVDRAGVVVDELE